MSIYFEPVKAWAIERALHSPFDNQIGNCPVCGVRLVFAPSRSMSFFGSDMRRAGITEKRAINFLSTTCRCGAEIKPEPRWVRDEGAHYFLKVEKYVPPHDHWDRYIIAEMNPDEIKGAPHFTLRTRCVGCQTETDFFIEPDQSEGAIAAYMERKILSGKPRWNAIKP